MKMDDEFSSLQAVMKQQNGSRCNQKGVKNVAIKIFQFLFYLYTIFISFFFVFLLIM